MIYVLVAVIGAYPEIAEPLDIKPIQAEAILLILLVLVGHGLVWDFMVRRPPGGSPCARLRGVTPERLAVLARVADALPDLDRPLLVAVDGGDGAGKTWFADELATVLADRDRVVVRASVDDFHHPRSHRHELGRTGETVWARSFDYRALRRELLDPWCVGPGRRTAVVITTWPPTPSSTRPARQCRSTASSSSTGSSHNARSCVAAGTWWSGWRSPTRSGYAGWPAATALPPTSPTTTSGATSTPSASIATRPTPSAPPTSSSTTPTRPHRPSSVTSRTPPGWRRVGDRVERTIVTDPATALRVNEVLDD